MRAIVEATEAALPPGAWPAWTGSNHDMSRFATRWAGGDPARARVALLMLLCLRGTPVLYQGDEIGLGDVAVAQEDLRDPLGVRYWPHYAGRDGMRHPDALAGHPRRRVHRARRPTMAAVRGRWVPPTSRTNGPTRARCSTWPGT